MTDQLAIDYAWTHPNPAAIKAAGYSAVIRYISTDPTKDITVAEAAGLHAAGLDIGIIWETTAQRALSGGAAGTSDGDACLTDLHALGVPVGSIVLVNVGDWAVTPGQISVIHDYYYAFHQRMLGWQFGGYGTAYIIEELVSQGALGIWWQNAMYDDGTPGNVVTEHASIYQRVTPTGTVNGVKVANPAAVGDAGQWDENVYGFAVAPVWWKPAAPAPAPVPAPVPAPAPVTLRSIAITATYSDGTTKTLDL